ncbi:hypothetical protein [Sphingobacterium mizutaii]|uniref:hypothetical protein n=1 Tax=Sphingobacterium mizutaii TaxID=1010 RepID=UPI0016280DD5|nr:hypothetical protein [Sphingobacterium mizutaii]
MRKLFFKWIDSRPFGVTLRVTPRNKIVLVVYGFLTFGYPARCRPDALRISELYNYLFEIMKLCIGV